MIVADIAKQIEQIAPKAAAQSWDNVGLLVGDANSKVKKILMAIDVTKAVVDEAKRQKVDMIVSYHPIIWDGLKKITAQSEKSVVYDLIRAGISVYSIHTSLDVVWGGVNDGLAEIVGIDTPEPIGDYVDDPAGDLYKLVVFVPKDKVNKVSKAIFKAGAGNLGNYSDCSFQSKGTGSFTPLEGANPAIGSCGQSENVEEIRFETIVKSSALANVIDAMKNAHPYEMPAYDVIKLSDISRRLGLGRMGKIKGGRKLADIIQDIKNVTGTDTIGMVGKRKNVIRSAAVCAGTCGKILNQVIAQGCDLYLTGELKHHEAILAQESGLLCFCLSHTVSERFILKNLQKTLKASLGDVQIKLSRKDRDPFVWEKV